MAATTLAVGAIFRNEAPYLGEWLQFHASVGVERFFLYDNQSTDDWRRAIGDSGVGERVVAVACPGEAMQMRAYANCLARFGPSCRWIAFIDLDEYLFATDGSDLRQVLESYAEHPAVGVNWAIFGTSGHRERPEGLVTRNYTRRGRREVVVPIAQYLKAPGLDPTLSSSYRPMCSHVKSVVQPARTLRPVTPHDFVYRDDAMAVTERGEPFSGPWSPSVSIDRLRLNHYWSKSAAELTAKTLRGHACKGPGPSLDYVRAVEGTMNDEVDTTIFPLARWLPGWRPAAAPA